MHLENGRSAGNGAYPRKETTSGVMVAIDQMAALDTYVQNHWISGLCQSSGILNIPETLFFSSCLEFQTMNKVQKPSDSER
jgi:hypothetical protein